MYNDGRYHWEANGRRMARSCHGYEPQQRAGVLEWLFKNAGLIGVGFSILFLVMPLIAREGTLEALLRWFLLSMFAAGFGIAWIIRDEIGDRNA